MTSGVKTCLAAYSVSRRRDLKSCFAGFSRLCAFERASSTCKSQRPEGYKGIDLYSLAIRTQKHTQFLDITREVQSSVASLGLENGVVTVFVPHTTAGITINENADPDITSDIAQALEKAAPWEAQYRHSEGNAAAHVKASMMGSSVQIIVENGRLQLGTWQAVYFCEFDGPRSRKVWVMTAGESR
jgi:secondary thiamine-phosphate synthase enzyme